MDRVVVIGLGYVGLPLAYEAQMSGFKITCLDVNTEVLTSSVKGRRISAIFAMDKIRPILQSSRMQQQLLSVCRLHSLTTAVLISPTLNKRAFYSIR